MVEGATGKCSLHVDNTREFTLTEPLLIFVVVLSRRYRLVKSL